MMSSQSCKTSASRNIPEFQGLIIAAAHELLSIGTECDRPDPMLMSGQRLDALPLIEIPLPNDVILSRTEERFTVGMKHGTPNASRVTL